MPYRDVAEMTRDEGLRRRIAACAAEEGVAAKYAPAYERSEQWAEEHIWRLCASPGWDDAWEYARLHGVNRAGWDSSVITDAMILSAVQPLVIAERDAAAAPSATP